VKADSWKKEQGRYSEGKMMIRFEVMAIRSIGSRMSKWKRPVWLWSRLTTVTHSRFLETFHCSSAMSGQSGRGQTDLTLSKLTKKW